VEYETVHFQRRRVIAESVTPSRIFFQQNHRHRVLVAQKITP